MVTVPGPMNGARSALTVRFTVFVACPVFSAYAVSGALTGDENRPASAANPAAQSSVPLLAARSPAGNAASVDAVVLFARGTSTAKLPDTDPDDGAPASDWRFSTHACTNTSTVVVTDTPVSVPNPGSNALIVEVPGESNVTLTLTCCWTVSAPATPG